MRFTSLLFIFLRYDFVGHQETLEEDIEQLMKILNLPEGIKLSPSTADATTAKSVFNWFKTVTLEDRRKVYALYEKDFKLFGYRKPEEEIAKCPMIFII